jgi:phage gpG-like protein
MSRATFAITRDSISPRIAKLAGIARHPEPVLRAMGNVFKSITEGNFNSSGADMRPSPWQAKKDGTPSNLKKSGLLWHSFNLTVDDRAARLANPTPYASIHQFGAADYIGGETVGTIKTKYANRRYAGSFQDVVKGGHGIPPRPFYPVLNGRLTPAAEDLIAKAGQEAILKQAQ